MAYELTSWFDNGCATNESDDRFAPVFAKRSAGCSLASMQLAVHDFDYAIAKLKGEHDDCSELSGATRPLGNVQMLNAEVFSRGWCI